MRLACLVPVLCAATAAAAPHARVEAAIDVDAQTATGTLTLDVDVVTDRVELWLFPARLAHPSPALDSLNFYWHYPRRFEAASIAVSDVLVDGKPAGWRIRDGALAGPRTLLDVLVPAPAAHARVTVRFATRIPTRYGAFGCYRRQCTLAGGFFPMPVARAPDGSWDETAPPAATDYDLALTAPGARALYVAGAPGGTAHVAAALDPLVVVDGDGRLVERRLAHKGVDVRLLTSQADVPPPVPPGRALPYTFDDRAGLALAALTEMIDVLDEEGVLPPPGTTLRLVEGPLRTEIAEPHGGAVLVSDQLYRVTPIGRIRKFHSLVLVRAAVAALLEPRLAAVESAADLGWVPDVAASWVAERFAVHEYRREETAVDVIWWAKFLPVIDQLIYAPQVEFADAYFGTLDEPDPTREDVRRFANLRPRGKVIWHKLRDLLGDARAAGVARASFRGTPLRSAATDAAGQPLAWFFAQWLGPYPDVNYRYQLRGPTVVDGKRRYEIVVEKQGRAPPVEPVEVRATEADGTRHDLVWDGHGRSGTLVVDAGTPLDAVEIDPRGRLREHLAGANDDLRLDDRRPARWKLLYNNLGALLDVQSGRLDLALDLSVARRHDVKNILRLVLYRDFATQVGVTATYTRSFGRMIIPNRLADGIFGSLHLARLQPTFGREGEPPAPGTQLALTAGIGHDDRFFVWEPWRATLAGAAATYTFTLSDAYRASQQVTVSAYAEHVEPIAVGHGVAVLASAAATFGDLYLPEQMVAASGPTLLRGYEPEELLGRLRVVVRGEYRHVFVHDLNTDILHYFFARGIAGALFTEAGAVSGCDGYGIGTHDLYGDVGYSLRVLGEWAGITRTQFNIDIALPLVRRGRGCFGPAPTGGIRPPVGLNIYFGPSW